MRAARTSLPEERLTLGTAQPTT